MAGSCFGHKWKKVLEKIIEFSIEENEIFNNIYVCIYIITFLPILSSHKVASLCRPELNNLVWEELMSRWNTTFHEENTHTDIHIHNVNEELFCEQYILFIFMIRRLLFLTFEIYKPWISVFILFMSKCSPICNPDVSLHRSIRHHS